MSVIRLARCYLQDTFSRAKTWVKELQRQASPNIVIALAGNKADMADTRAVEHQVGRSHMTPRLQWDSTVTMLSQWWGCLSPGPKVLAFHPQCPQIEHVFNAYKKRTLYNGMFGKGIQFQVSSSGKCVWLTAWVRSPMSAAYLPLLLCKIIHCVAKLEMGWDCVIIRTYIF